MTPAGIVTHFDLPTANSKPVGITAGPDGNLWVTEYATSRIAKVKLS
jgi:virginiamycin B lyase